MWWNSKLNIVSRSLGQSDRETQQNKTQKEKVIPNMSRKNKNIAVAPVAQTTVETPTSNEVAVIDGKAELVVLTEKENEAKKLLEDNNFAVDNGFHSLWLTVQELSKTAGNKYCEAVTYITNHFHPEAETKTAHWEDRKLGQKRVLKTLLLSGMSVGSANSTVSRLFNYAHPKNALILGLYGEGKITQEELRDLTGKNKAALVESYSKGEIGETELIRANSKRQAQLPSGDASNGGNADAKKSPEDKIRDSIREAVGIALRLETPWTLEQFIEAATKGYQFKKELIETQKLEAAKKQQEAETAKKAA